MTENKATPRWLDPLTRLAAHIEEASDLIILSWNGICALTDAPPALWPLESGRHPSDAAAAQAQLDAAPRMAQLAQTEVDTGFPLLCAQATISLWADLENGLRTFFAAWLQHVSSAKTVEPIQKLKVSLGEYEAMNADERCLYIIDRLEQEIESRNRRGIDRFELLFATFGFETTLDKRLRRDLLEVYFVRNVLVHRRGIADRRFIESCPWLRLSVGDHITVTFPTYTKYMHAVTAYVGVLSDRVRARLGIPLQPSPPYQPHEAPLTSAFSSDPVKAVPNNRSGP